MYDIAILGAGPAGSTLARLLSSRYKTLLIDKRHLLEAESGPFRKSCGGLIAPDAQKELCRLGLGLPREIMAGPQLFGVRTLDLEHSYECLYQRYYYNVDREAFDRWLLSLVPDRVEVRMGCSVTGITQEDEGYRLNLRGDQNLSCRILLGADGASSLVRRMLGPQAPSIRRYLSIQECFESDRDDPHYGVLFDNSITDFYSWTISKNGTLLIGSAFPEGTDARRLFEQLKEKMEHRGFRWGRFLHREGAVINRPSSLREICYGSGQAALAGEAAGWISPSSAEGISFALRSARVLAASLNQSDQGFLNRYRQGCSSLRRSLLGKWLKSPGMYQPLLRRLVLQSSLASMTPIT